VKKSGHINEKTTHEQVSQELAALRKRVAELEKIQAEFERLREKYKTSLESITDGFVSFDREWHYTYVNDAALRVLQKSPEELLGRTPWEAFPESPHLKFYTEFTRSCDQDIPVHFEEFYPEPLNSWFECHCYPEPDGLSVYFQDVTERKRVEETLRESERRERERAEELAIVLEAVPTPVVIVHDPDATHMTGNRAADELLQQQHGAEASLSAPPEARPRHFRAIKDGRELRVDELPAQRAALGEQVRDFEFSLVFDDNTIRHVLGYGTPLLDDKGQPRGAVHVLVDITERKKAEERAEHLASFPQLNPNPILEVDASGKITFFNQTCQTILENLGMDKGDLKAFLPEDLDAIIQDWDKNNATTLYREVLMADRVFDETVHLVPQFKVVRIYGRDITDRKLAEEALQESEEKFRLLFESMAEGVALHEMIRDDTGKAVDYRILNVNPAYAQQTGIPRERANNALASELYEAGAPPYLREYEEVVSSDRALFFETYFPPLKKYFSISANRTKPNQFVTVFLDITQRKQAEEELRKGQIDMDRAQEVGQIGSWRLDIRRNTLTWSDEVHRIFGVTKGTPLTYEAFLAIIHPDDRQYVDTQWNAGLAGEPYDIEHRIVVNGQVRWVREKAYLEFDDTGALLGGFGITQDITDRKQLEEELRRSRDDLDLRVRKRTAELQQAYQKLVEETEENKRLETQLRQAQKMEAIGTLAGGIAHDFNNILAAIIGFGEMVEEDLPPDSPSIPRIQRVLSAASRGTELVRQILAFSRKTELTRTPLSLAPLIKETIQLLRASLPTTIEIKLSTKAARDTILASPAELQQILMNLVTNASFAMKERGGLLGINITNVDFKPDSPVFDADIEPGEYVQIVVTDTGSGMTPDVMKRIFEPFFTTKGVGEGTGMGLPVVYGIVKSLHGTISVESEPGAGSTFRVFLPITRTDEKLESSEVQVTPKGTERILFVDDEELLTEWGQASLERLGYTVTALTDSTEALNLFSSEPSRFDLVVLDQTMPKLTGLNLARELRQIRPDLPIILCTGHSDSVSPQKASEAGIKEFLIKPIAKQQLATVVRSVLDTKSED